MSSNTLTQSSPLFIAGAEVPGEAAEVRNPARLTETVGSYGRAGRDLAETAVTAAHRAFPGWANTPAARRAHLLLAGVADVEAEIPALATLLTREHGKILADATAELTNTVKTLRYYAGLADHVERETRTDDHRGRIIERHVPMGVVAVVVPWNYPVLLATLMYAPALMAGNTVVLKLPDNAPLALSSVLLHLARRLPPGVLNVLAGAGREIGVHLTTHPLGAEGELHRQHRHRAHHHAGRQQQPEEPRARTGRQRPSRRAGVRCCR